MPGRDRERYTYITLAIPRDNELDCAIQEEVECSGEPPSIVARAMLNAHIQQRDLATIIDARLQQLSEQLTALQVAPVVVSAPAPVNTNADEALEAWEEYDDER